MLELLPGLKPSTASTQDPYILPQNLLWQRLLTGATVTFLIFFSTGEILSTLNSTKAPFMLFSVRGELKPHANGAGFQVSASTSSATLPLIINKLNSSKNICTMN